VTMFEVKPAPGVKIEKIANLQNNIKMNLKAESLRILAPIPGKDTVGIEVPNTTSSAVSYKEMLQTPTWRNSDALIPICLGKDIQGKPQILDLAAAPHLLIAGQTGSGKSVCMNTLILSLLYKFRPDQLKMILVDPKKVEFKGYDTLPHLITPVISDDMKKVPLALNWSVQEMENRYSLLALAGCRNIEEYNNRKLPDEVQLDKDGKPLPDKLPYIVIIIDELADLMMTYKQEVETLLARIAQMARAVGIHAVIATQRPSVNIITGVIKANFPTRIAFRVSSVTDSRTILDGKGADMLLGKGDMLYKSPKGSNLERVQGCFLDNDEIERVVEFIAKQGDQDFLDDMYNSAGSASGGGGVADGGSDISAEDEELIQRAIAVIMKDRRASTSHIQRQLRIGYNRASIIIEELENRGIVGPQIGSAPRDILMETGPENSESDEEDKGEESDSGG
ncbi:MAG: DNA translocase FtsK, partial [Lentisphaeria bacterium]|nr:DNA translocase FtsK [Lentisphaeria bacterium]